MAKGRSKKDFFLGIISKKGGVGIPKLYVKNWWPLFWALKFTFLSLNLAKISLFLPKSAQGKKGMKEQPATLLFYRRLVYEV